MDAIMKIAADHKLRVIEDNAQAIGTTYNGKFTGTFGAAGVLSLNYHKIIHSGEGGMVLCSDDDVAAHAQMVRNHGETVVEAMGWRDIANTMGSNYRMTEIEAAIASEQLRKLGALLQHRRMLASHLTRRLAALGEAVRPPSVNPAATHAYYVYALRLSPQLLGISRRTFVSALAAEGMPFGEGYVRPLYLLPVFQQKKVYPRGHCPWTCGEYEGSVSYDKGLCPMAERLHEEELILADICHHPLTIRDMDDVADAFEKVISNLSELRDWEHEQKHAKTESADGSAGRWRR
jgi:dTDP-4-amino-4,6-dideoxygalactose transaminase